MCRECWCCCCDEPEEERGAIYGDFSQRDYGDECDNMDWKIRDGFASAMESALEMQKLMQRIIETVEEVGRLDERGYLF